jgi:hypothetical protein
MKQENENRQKYVEVFVDDGFPEAREYTNNYRRVEVARPSSEGARGLLAFLSWLRRNTDAANEPHEPTQHVA